MAREEQFQDMIARLFPEEGKDVKTITFAVTNACSLRCDYCYQGHKGNDAMDFATAKAFVDRLLDDAEKEEGYVTYNNTSGVIFEFIGGEPFLQPKLMLKIMDYISSELINRKSPWATRFYFNTTSNGIAFYDEAVQEIVNKYKSRFSVSITIDGNKELHDSCRKFPDGRGSYDIAIKAALECKDTYGQDGTKITLAPENIVHTSSAVIHMIELGYKSIHANCIYEEGWTKEHAKIFYDECKILADYLIDNDLWDKISLSIFDDAYFAPMAETELNNWCGTTNAMLAVDHNGDIFPCIRYMENSLNGDQPPLVIGHISHGVGYTEEEKERINVLSKISRRTQSTDECFYCPIAFGCAWCSALHYQLYGTTDKRATFICIMHKARALGNLYLYRRLEALGKRDHYVSHISDEMALEVIDEAELLFLKSI